MESNWNDFSPWLEDNIVEVLNAKVPIFDLLDLYGIEYIQNKVRCPFHADGTEKTPSLVVYPETNTWHCFACNKGTSIIDFVQYMDGTNYYAAIEKLCSIAGLKEGEVSDFKPKPKRLPEETVRHWVIKTQDCIKDFIQGREDWEYWAEERYAKLDYMMDNWEDEQWEKVKQYYERIDTYLKKWR